MSKRKSILDWLNQESNSNKKYRPSLISTSTPSQSPLVSECPVAIAQSSTARSLVMSPTSPHRHEELQEDESTAQEKLPIESSLPKACSTISDPTTSTTQELLDDNLTPYQPRGFDFPKRQFGDRHRAFLPIWFDKHEWLNYVPKTSDDGSVDSVTCSICTRAYFLKLFLPTQRLENSFLEKGFSNWKKCPKRFVDHERSTQHTSARSALKNLAKPSIPTQLSKQADLEAVAHRRALTAIFESAMYLSRQGIAFQGSTSSEGNFFQLLKLRGNDNKDVKDWIIRRDNWLSHDMQNEMIQEIAKSIQRSIASEIQKADFFSCIADGTQDIQGHEQLTVLFRIVRSDFQSHDLFLGYYNISDSSGQSIAAALKDVAIRFNIPFEKCCGLGFDGASNMSAAFKGAQAAIKKDFPSARYQHCANHRLDLCLQETAKKEKLISDTLERVRRVAVFVKESGKRLQQYNNICEEIANSLEDDSKDFSQLVALCPTRWVIRVKGIAAILRNFQPLIKLFYKISLDKTYSSESRSKADSNYKKLMKFETILGLHISLTIFEESEKLAKKLQSPKMSIGHAHQAIILLKHHMKTLRTDQSFSDVLEKTNSFREENGLPCPEAVRRKRLPKWLDENPGSTFHHSSIYDQYRVDYFSIIDRMIQTLDKRFDDNFLKACHDIETSLVNACKEEKNAREIEKVWRSEYFPTVDDDALQHELKTLPTLAKQTKSNPTSFDEFLAMLRSSPETSLVFFPEVTRLARLLLTFPVSVASAERTFSTLRRLKNWQRSSMGQERLTALAVCNIHKAFLDNIDTNDLCDNFISKTDERRKVFSSKRM